MFVYHKNYSYIHIKMKIAILFTGRINCNEEQYQNFLTNCVQYHQVDLFVSHNKTDKTHIIDKFIELYHPVMIRQNEEIKIDLSNYKIPNEYENRNIYNILYMHQSRLNVWNMLEEYTSNNTDVKYDIIFSSRNDLWFENKINYEDMKPYIDNHYLCIPKIEWDFSGLNDQLAFSDYESIAIYLKLYHSFFDILDSGIILHPETLLYQYLIIRNHVTIHRLLISYDIIRRYTETQEDTSM